MAELLGRTVGEIRATMTLPEFLAWQAYARHKAAAVAKPGAAPDGRGPTAELVPLAALAPGALARVIGQAEGGG